MIKTMFLVAVLLGASAPSPAAPIKSDVPGQNFDWPVFGGDKAQTHFSALTQINAGNIKSLTVAWKYDTKEKGGLENSPIIVGRTLFAFTPTQKVIALDATNGKLLWTFDSGVSGSSRTRGLTYWTDGRRGRILAGILNYLYAIDASTGKVIPDFGNHGRIDLRKGLRGDYRTQNIQLTSPGTVYKNLVIVGGELPETHPSPPGLIRAFDVQTGALRWAFNPIPGPAEFGYATWPKDAYKTAGSANNWAGMTLDEKTGILYVPTGSAVFDFYGGDRIGNDLFADSLVALDAGTGKRIWHFQGVHHDIWDRDFDSRPTLVTVKRDGKNVKAVAQTGKAGLLFLLDSRTGKPLFPIEERKVPPSKLPGEVASPTQPFPVLPAPFARQALTEDMLTDRTPEAHEWAVKQFKTFVNGGQFMPVDLDKQTVIMPGLAGGAEWGGSALDPRTAVIYVNANDTAWLEAVIKPPPPGSAGEKIFQNQCSVCHGVNRAGSPPMMPSLINVDHRLTDDEILNTIGHGRGRMPAFTNISDHDLKELLRYLKTPPQQMRRDPKSISSERPEEVKRKEPPVVSSGENMPYKFSGYRRFTDPDGYPAVAPPWGTLNAIDLNTGKYVWKIPLGEYPELAAKGILNTGSDNQGGPIVTASGLLFIGATYYDKKFRAFDSKTGKLLWEVSLPFSGISTPVTYMIDGKQYVVIACGGQGDRGGREKSGGVYVAFTLP